MINIQKAITRPEEPLSEDLVLTELAIFPSFL